MNRYRPPDLLIKLIYWTCYFTQFLPHLTLGALMYVYSDSTTALNVNCLWVRPNPSNILKQLQSLDVNKASLGLSSKLLRACANEILPSLCRLFNLSLELGTFPEKWKIANLVPIHKCESKTMVLNYRGISLLDVLSQILERQVYNEIFSIICPHLAHWQHCFLPGKSTVSQLSQVAHQFANALERRQQVDVIYVDFLKAFDRVSHENFYLSLNALSNLGSCEG